MIFESKQYDPSFGLQAAQIAAATGVRFAHLHAHTTFSFLDGYGTAKQIAERIKELGHTSCAITDHGNVVGHVPVGKAMRAAGVNPVFGCEFYICDDMHQKGKHAPSLPVETKKNSPGPLPHITVLAQTQEGYENLLALSTASFREGFHHRPRIDHKSLVARQKGLVVLSGCPGGYPSRLLELGLHQQAWDLMVYLSQTIENYYIEVTPSPGYDTSHRVTDVLFSWAKALGRPVVMTADAHFPRPEDHEAQDLLLAVGLRKTVDDPTRELRLPDFQFYCDAQNMLARSLAVCSVTSLDDQLQAMNNAALIADSCRVEIPQGKRVAFPKVPQGETPGSMLRLKCWEGLHVKFGKGQVQREQWDEYWSRAERELAVIESKGYSDYMLAVADVVIETQDKGGLVNLRGSAGGSMILWLIGCSTTDPVLHGLSFERFYDDTRPDPPDVDIDFEKASRPGAIEYVAELYGRDKVAQIAGLSQMKGRGALQNLCAGLGIHSNDYRHLSELIDHDATEEAVMAAIGPLVEKRPEVGRLLPKVMWQLKTTTVHAAGVLVSSEPLSKCVGIMNGGDDQPVASVDKRGAAELGLLKMDFLNVQALDVVGTAARLVCEATGTPNIDWLYDLPLNDPHVFAMARAGLLAGVFQLDGGSAWKAAQAIRIDDFNDLVAASVLCRPGPIESIGLYRRHKDDPNALALYLSQFSPAAAAIVAETNGVLMYQEQVMRLAREVAGMEWQYVHKLRKGVADKLGLNPLTGDAWRAEWSARFIEGCRATVGMSDTEALHWWHSVETHGGYSFNKSHGVSYGIVGYWMLWLKTYWPAQFYEAFLKLEGDNDFLRKRLILEFKKMGGKVYMLDPVNSRESFRSVGKDSLFGGYQDIRGMGPKTADKVAAAGPFADWAALMDALPKAVAAQLNASKFWDPNHCDPSLISLLAPWFPIPGMPVQDLMELTRRGVAPCGNLTPEPIDSVAVGGYVTTKDFKSDKMALSIEDPRGMIQVRVARKNVNGAIGQRMRQVKVGDLIAVDGWWAGDCLFARDVAIVRAS
jgi:DNA polymerase III subunit alpha